MIETDLDHCRIVMESLNRGGALDPGAHASLDVLSHRLEMLKKSYPRLGKVAFSPAVERSGVQASVPTTG
ncbi:MAG: hypothetical protein IIA65_04940 [Planctomycetes bacterium]|nr:hypothetical protein [Planctomycetota bacterium]